MRDRYPDPIGLQYQSRLAGGVDGVGDVKIVSKALGEVLPRMHGRVFGDVGLAPVRRCSEFVVARDLCLIVGAFVAEKLTALTEISGGAGLGFNKLVLVVVADLVAEMPQ